MRKNELSTFARALFALVGVTGLGSAIWAVLNWGVFTSMPGWSIAAFTIAVVGSVNWGVVAINNDKRKDLLWILGL